MPTARDMKPEVLGWLSPPDVASKHASVVSGRFPGTCSWVFAQEAYVKWSNHSGLLWMNGIGKLCDCPNNPCPEKTS